jgi:hypothetical protein
MTSSQTAKYLDARAAIPGAVDGGASLLDIQNMRAAWT